MSQKNANIFQNLPSMTPQQKQMTAINIMQGELRMDRFDHNNFRAFKNIDGSYVVVHNANDSFGRLTKDKPLAFYSFISKKEMRQEFYRFHKADFLNIFIPFLLLVFAPLICFIAGFSEPFYFFAAGASLIIIPTGAILIGYVFFHNETYKLLRFLKNHTISTIQKIVDKKGLSEISHDGVIMSADYMTEKGLIKNKTMSEERGESFEGGLSNRLAYGPVLDFKKEHIQGFINVLMKYHEAKKEYELAKDLDDTNVDFSEAMEALENESLYDWSVDDLNSFIENHGMFFGDFNSYFSDDISDENYSR